jgi:hypothetical protein
MGSPDGWTGFSRAAAWGRGCFRDSRKPQRLLKGRGHTGCKQIGSGQPAPGHQDPDSQQDYGRETLPSNGKVRVEIMVQRETNAFVIARPFQNDNVLRFFQAKPLCEGQAPGPAKSASCNAVKTKSFIVDRSGCVPERLLNIFWLKKRVFGKKGVAVRIHREQLQNTTHGDPQFRECRAYWRICLARL